MKIKILQVGKNKDAYITEACDEYLKRLRAFGDFEVVTVKEISPSKTFDKARCVEEEGVELLKAIGEDFAIVLDEKGKGMDSVGFADYMSGLKDKGRKVVFVIGGPFGLSDAVRERADFLFSVSSLTFTHQMVRIILLEQLYRSFSIMHGKDYHH